MLRWPKKLQHNTPDLPLTPKFSTQFPMPEKMSPITPYFPTTTIAAIIPPEPQNKKLKNFNLPINSANISLKPFLPSPTAMHKLRVISLFSISFLCIASLSSTALALLSQRENTDSLASGSCDMPVPRKEWRTLQPDEKKSYIDAVLCLQGLPAALSSTIPGAVSRFDDFVGLHISQMEKVHLNGQFLPWHRYFTAVFEDSLRIHCGYAGGQPYWDWTLDIKPGKAFADSPVFSPTDGFGGNGPYIPCAEQPYNLFCLANGTGGGCVSDGPFKNAVLHLGPGRNIESNNHCLTRNFHPQFPAQWLSEAEVNRTMAEGSYGRFWRHLEGMFEVERMGLHGAGHLGIGDPLFYLHHANLDRLWWKWQEQTPQPRLKEVSGPVSQKQGAGNVTLSYEIDFGKVAGKVNIVDVMHIKQKALCYDYP